MRPKLTLRLPSDLLLIEGTVDRVVEGWEPYIRRERRASRVRMSLRVVLAEALANAILYGNESDPSKQVRVELSVTERAFVARITDEGVGFDHERVPDPTTPEALLKSDGRGIFLMRELVDEVSFNDCGNSVTLILARDPMRTG